MSLHNSRTDQTHNKRFALTLEINNNNEWAIKKRRHFPGLKMFKRKTLSVDCQKIFFKFAVYHKAGLIRNKIKSPLYTQMIS